MMKKFCLNCNQVFYTNRTNQIFCSVHCRKIHHKKVYYNRDRLKRIDNVEKSIINSFKCKKCHNLVYIRDKDDKRTKFCCPRCEKLYWKHSKKHKGKI